MKPYTPAKLDEASAAFTGSFELVALLNGFRFSIEHERSIENGDKKEGKKKARYARERNSPCRLDCQQLAGARVIFCFTSRENLSRLARLSASTA